MHSPSPTFLFAAVLAAALPQSRPVDPFASFTREWRDDPVWHDGKAEYAVYDARRTIYGKPRRFAARVITNREKADPATTTKAVEPGAPGVRDVFKHHVRADVPTDNYAYHFSTMAYVGADDLKSLKLDMGSQEDCGATFKQFVNHGGNLEWRQSSYFPGEGAKSGSYAPPEGFVFEDALALVLRGYPFARPDEIGLMVLPDQTTNKLGPATPVPATVTHVGRATLEVPFGKVDAHHLVLRREGAPERHYWFAADPGLLHVLVRQEGPDLELSLRELKRWAYWER
jgi:hypothetical protein